MNEFYIIQNFYMMVMRVCETHTCEPCVYVENRCAILSTLDVVA